MNNVIALSVQDTIEDIAPLYVEAIKSKVPFSTIPAPMLWGPPGVGKSDSAKQIAREIEKATGKTVHITDVRLNLFNPIDLRGIPVANPEKTLAVWLKPKIFDMDSSEDVVNILFLDEISAAPQTVQAAAYQITLDRTIGEHELPENCIVMAAGNRTTDRSVAYRMPNALANRLRHIEVTCDFESWSGWAMHNHIHPLVLGYLSYDNSKLYQENTDMDQVAFPTPRSWVFVSNILNLMCKGDAMDDVEKQYSRIAGCVGTGTALEFIAYAKKHNELPMVKDIFVGKRINYPNSMDGLYSLIVSMLSYIKTKEALDELNGISETELENACRYASGFPADYKAFFYVDLIDIKTLRKKLVKSTAFKEWFKINESNELRNKLENR